MAEPSPSLMTRCGRWIAQPGEPDSTTLLSDTIPVTERSCENCLRILARRDAELPVVTWANARRGRSWHALVVW